MAVPLPYLDARAPAPAGAPRILTTLHWPKRRAWVERADVLRRDRLSTPAILARLVAQADRYDALVLDGATGGAVRLTDLGAAAVLARRRRGPAVILTDATWDRGKNLLDGIGCRAGLRAIDSPRVTYCVLSRDEERLFPSTWGVEADRVVFTPFYLTAGDEDLAAPTRDDGGVFAGGDSLRDYRPLVEAARGLDAPVTIATRTLAGAALPAHVRAAPVPHARFMELMRAASVVVVPLAATRDRAAGQQTYLNAMAFGKLVVVPDVLGVRDYVEHGRTGIVVPAGDAAALRRALAWALHPTSREAVRAIAARAREVARERFAPERYVDAVLAAVDAAVRRLRGLTPSRSPAPGAAAAG